MAARSPNIPLCQEVSSFSEPPAFKLPHSATWSHSSTSGGPARSPSQPTTATLTNTQAGATTASGSGARSSLYPTSLSDGCIPQPQSKAEVLRCQWGDLYPSTTDIESDCQWSPPASPKCSYSTVTTTFAGQPQATRRSNEHKQQPQARATTVSHYPPCENPKPTAEDNLSGLWLPDSEGASGPSLAGGSAQAANTARGTGRQKVLQTQAELAPGCGHQPECPSATFAPGLYTGRIRTLSEGRMGDRPHAWVTSSSYHLPGNSGARHHGTDTVFPSSRSAGSITSGGNSSSSQWNAGNAAFSPTGRSNPMKGKQRRGARAAPVSPPSQWHSSAGSGQKEVTTHALERSDLVVTGMLQTSSTGAATVAASASRTPPPTRSEYRNRSQGSVLVDSKHHRRSSDTWTAPLGSEWPVHSLHSSRGARDGQWRGKDRDRQHSSSFSHPNSRRERSRSNPNILLMPTSPLPLQKVEEGSASWHEQHPLRDPVPTGNRTMASSQSQTSLQGSLPPPANLSPPARANSCLLLGRLNHVDQRPSTAGRSPRGGASLWGPAANVGAIPESRESTRGHVASEGKRESVSPTRRSNSTRSRHSRSFSASATMASVSPGGMSAVTRLFEQFSLLTRGTSKDRGPGDMAQSVSGRQRTLSSESSSRQVVQAEGRRAERAACYSDSGSGAVDKSGQQQPVHVRERSRSKIGAMPSNSESRSVALQRPTASSHAAMKSPVPLAGTDTHVDGPAPMDRPLSSGRLGHSVGARVRDRHADYDMDRRLENAVRHMTATATMQCPPGRCKTPTRSALKCSAKREEFSVVRPRQVQFVNDGLT